jgi:glycosyltransferase involved in cell wall biosynthesis
LLDVSSPTKVPEYLALGVPVVCNDNPDQAEVIAATGCGLCVPFTAQDFADAALALLGQGDEQLAKMQRAATAYLGQHRDYAHIAGALAARYAQLLP